MNESISRILDGMAFNQVENYSLEQQLAVQMAGFDDEQIEEVAQALLEKIRHLTHRSDIPLDAFLQRKFR